jgi:hypothetical protein
VWAPGAYGRAMGDLGPLTAAAEAMRRLVAGVAGIEPILVEDRSGRVGPQLTPNAMPTRGWARFGRAPTTPRRRPVASPWPTRTLGHGLRTSGGSCVQNAGR